ncbi:hypothetical protein SCMC78_13960 [Streptomyces sp. CMC78]|uniref:Uncharacterized protein n=1 Tax=Streptomyces sp. CMC78 TaxID=3231512 RepID=A0AB33K7H7_9ACTN
MQWYMAQGVGMSTPDPTPSRPADSTAQQHPPAHAPDIPSVTQVRASDPSWEETT